MTPARAYYNEIDPNAAAWLRVLIARGLIADGEVDTRSIADVRADDLGGFVQWHFFAGIGGWSYALRLAGWPDDRPVWTGSCPCQPFSAAGNRGGTSDERHLWPEFYRLIGERRPSTVFGEQVASPAGLGWLDAVFADLEDAGYACGAADLCAAGRGAPHIRQRLFFVAERLADGDDAVPQGRWQSRRERAAERSAGPGGVAGGLANTLPAGRAERRAVAGDGQASGGSGDSRLADADGGNAGAERQQRGGQHGQQPQDGGAGGLANAGRERDELGRGLENLGQAPSNQQGETPERERRRNAVGDFGSDSRRPGPADGAWRDADWLFCRDGKWRPVEAGTFPLAHGLPARVGRLRGYGNAIVPQLAAAFIEAAS